MINNLTLGFIKPTDLRQSLYILRVVFLSRTNPLETFIILNINYYRFQDKRELILCFLIVSTINSSSMYFYRCSSSSQRILRFLWPILLRMTLIRATSPSNINISNSRVAISIGVLYTQRVMKKALKVPSIIRQLSSICDNTSGQFNLIFYSNILLIL